MSMLRSFVRRLALQALVSSIAMAGIQVALHLSPALLVLGPATPEASGPSETDVAAPAPMPAPAAMAFAQDRRSAEQKSGRLPVWVRQASFAPSAPVRLAERRVPPVASGVLLFDRCVPSCESQDPLLAVHRVPPPVPADEDAVPAPDPAPLADTAPASPPVPAAAPEGEGRIGTLARGSLSWARRMVGTVGETLSP